MISTSRVGSIFYLSRILKEFFILQLDLSTIIPALSGPKRPHDYVPLKDMKTDFNKCMTNKVGFKGFGIAESELVKKVPFEYEGKKHELKHGDVVIAAITSCTNTSNPNVMIGAGKCSSNTIQSSRC